MNSPHPTFIDYPESPTGYMTTDSQEWSDARSFRLGSSSHKTSFLDMSPVRCQAPPHPYANAKTGSNSYTPGLVTESNLPETYTLSSDQLVQLAAAVQQLPTPSQSNDSIRSHQRLPTHSTPSFRHMFPSIEPSVLSAVMHHAFNEDELYKLDSDAIRRKGRVSFDRHGRGFDATGTSTEDYPTLPSLLDPLATYFRILLAACTDVAHLQQLADGSHQYIARLAAFADRYDWPAVLAYHFDFHRLRLQDMRAGRVSRWGEVDVGLHGQHLAGREKGYLPGSVSRQQSLSSRLGPLRA